MNSVEDAMLELAWSLKDDCTRDEVAERFDVIRRIEQGLADAEDGRLSPHDEHSRRLDEDGAEFQDGQGPATSKILSATRTME